ncbi:MAG: DUF1188 domain-containing protein [Methanobacteriaceae archaeon]|jgi:hypothetical protein|nr:MAG: hypothetical protein CIT01_01050 [Methanobacterium sp. BRmetb2]MCC7558356.1 DUF1188 domain-containing protein [Methanobacteriaceae archaeon]
MIIKERGITDEVFTLLSTIKVCDLVDLIIEKKCLAALNWIKSLDVNIEQSTIIGTYLTGIRLAEILSEFSKVSVVDINPHLKDMINCEIDFYNDLSNIEGSDLVVDTTGLGGISSKVISEYVDSKIFLVEDPTSDGSDKLISQKNDTAKRLKASESQYKGVLTTVGLNSKTSGTMTLTTEILRRSLGDILKTEGVLYAVANMNFYEGLLFKEKDIKKFYRLLNRPSIVISSLKPVAPDKYIEYYIEKIKCKVEYVSI